ncbi:helix-turn-helix domain-containing protein [Streptomyces sp. URMC 127]|uniref:helix-turn-helix domain-containing protein n=1 Tax=Streptomyces sp. URMC 127 TaxID=3423402 RepID=UPI003F1A372F
MTFGEEIKHARESRGWSQAKLADELHFQQPYVSKVETGRQLASAQFAKQCDVVFGTPGVYARMRRRAVEWGNPMWFIPYLRLEREARAICDYSTTRVTGILQTPKYAEAVFRAAHRQESAERIQAWVEKRIQRREVFERADPLSLSVILYEPALWATVGGPDVMRAQLRYLVAASESPHITLQVFPISAGTAVRGAPFTLVTAGDGTQVLYEETYTRGQVDDSAEAVAEARAAYELLRTDALSREDSVSLIRHVMEAYTHEHPMEEVQLQRSKRRFVRGMGPRPRLVRRRSRPGQQEP